ncbi:MAG: amino acid ABC transporter permease [Oscillospiraceae bacterium]
MTVSAMLTLLVQGFGKSLEIFTLTLLGSLPLGLLVMFGRRSRVAPLRWLVKLFISVMRGTPLMLQLMVVYYGPFLLFDFTPPGNWRFGAVIVGFVINYAAYFAEIYRAGYESIPVGQFEAAQVLGYTGGQTFGRILLPQMIRRVLPPVTNEVITLVKDTSLASVIGTVEMFTRAKQIVASPNTPGMLALAAAGLFTTFSTTSSPLRWSVRSARSPTTSEGGTGHERIDHAGRPQVLRLAGGAQGHFPHRGRG